MAVSSVSPDEPQWPMSETPYPRFDDVYAAHADRVYRFFLSQLRDPALAEDLGAETFVRAFTAYSRDHPDPERIVAWIFAIARNVAIDHHRRNRRWRRALDDLRHRPEPTRDVESMAADRAHLDSTLVALQRLRPRARQIIGLRMNTDMSHAEIGALLGMSERAAIAATHRALQRLRELTAEEMGDDAP